MLNLCSTHCLGWGPNQANHWVPSPAPHQTPLQVWQDLRHCHTSAKVCPQFHSLTWPSLDCQLRCYPSWQVRMHCSAWHRDRWLRAWRCQELVVGPEFWDGVPALTAQCRWDLQPSPQALHWPWRYVPVRRCQLCSTMPRQILHQKTAAAAMKRTWTLWTTAPGRREQIEHPLEDPLEDHNVHMASAPLYWRTAGVRPLPPYFSHHIFNVFMPYLASTPYVSQTIVLSTVYLVFLFYLD